MQAVRVPLPIVALSLITAVAVGMIAYHFAFTPAEADSDGHGETEVRISAKRLESGVVEFALQQRDGDHWGERIAPRSRYFPTNARVDHWLNSSPIAIDTPAPASGPMPTLCVVADGDPSKLFWQFVAFHTERAAQLIGVELEYSSHADAHDRVEAIEECVEHGANMIVATLADADEIIPALHEAAEHGVKIASFGAGEEHADRAGSLIHVSLNESAAGRRAAEQFDSRGVSGDVLCLVPHDAHDGLADVCDGLEDAYSGGHVEQIDLTGEDAAHQIEDLLSDQHHAAGLLVLEADLLPAAIEAIEHAGVEPILGSIGEYPLSRLSFAQRDRIAFTVMDLARFETLLSAAALHYMYSNHPNARFFDGAMIFDGEPNVHTGGAKGGHGRPDSTSGQSHGDDH